MRRFQGETLPSRPTIAIVANDALGNYVVSTPLLQMLREKYPDATLEYYGGTRTQELWQNESLLDFGYPLLGSEPRNSTEAIQRRSPSHLVVNFEFSPWAMGVAAMLAGDDGYVVGPCVGIGGRERLPNAPDERGRLADDPEWIAPDLTTKYPFLERGFIGEIFCRLAYLQGPVPPYRVRCDAPGSDVPEILIATSASLPEKLWGLENWLAVLTELKKQGKSVGLLGAKPSAQKQFWKGDDAEDTMVREGLVADLRGTFTLPQVVGALAQCRQVLTLDNGILHLAAATPTRTVGLFREGIHRLWAPPVPNLDVLTPEPGAPVSDITVEAVLEALSRA